MVCDVTVESHDLEAAIICCAIHASAVRSIEVNSPAMAASSFTHEQIRHFREAFSQYSDPESGGVTSQRFSDAILACLEHCSLSATPPPDYLNSEFNRLGTTGALTWQQFFQVS